MTENENTDQINSSTTPAKSKKKLFTIVGIIAVIAIGVGAFALMSGDKSKNDFKGTGETHGGNSADENGLVDAQSLECLPRGHDNYRTDSTLAVDPNDADVIYVGVEYKGIFKSTDGGETWKQSDKGVRGYPKEGNEKEKCVQELGRIIIDPKDSNHLLMARVESPGDLSTLFSENAGLWESKDAGKTWKQLLTSEMNASGSRGVVFAPDDSKTIYLGVNNQPPSYKTNDDSNKDKYILKEGIIYVTYNGGESWEELPTGLQEGFRAVNVAVDSDNPKTIWLFPFTQDLAGGQFKDEDQKGPMKSTDGGKTWTAFADKLPKGFRVLVDGQVNPADGDNAFISTQNMTQSGKSFVTLDGGETWKETNQYIYLAVYDTNDPTGNRMLGYEPTSTNGGIYESLDKGLTWTSLSAVPKEVNNSDKLGVRIEGFAMSSASPGVIYMSGSNANVWKSEDNGKTWKSVMTLEDTGGPNKNKEGSTKSRESDQ